MTAVISQPHQDAPRPDVAYSPTVETMMHSAREASDFLKALSHEYRLLLLCLLAERERSVGELETILSLRQPTVSQQLARLRYDGLVTTRRDGKTIYYSIANENVKQIITVIYNIYCDPKSKSPE